MAKQNRIKTKYPGVFYILGKSIVGDTEERVYYIRYRKGERLIEEKVGRQLQGMTPARANEARSLRIQRKQLSNQEKREEKDNLESRWTISKLWKAYKQTQDNHKGKATDESRFNKHLRALFGEKETQEIEALEVDKLRIQLLKVLSPQTVKHVLVLLNRIINFGVRKNLCLPLSFKIQFPKVDNEKTETLTQTQLKELLKAIEEDENIQAKNFLKLVLLTGMRRGELFKLKWDDINFERGFILIRDPKGGKSQEIPMSIQAKEVLKNHEKPYPNSPYVFPGKGGQQRTEIKRPVNRIREKANLPKDFRPIHGLRHVFATLLASSGEANLYEIQKLLTHKSPKTTQRYAHLADESLKKKSNLLGKILLNTATQKSFNE